MTTLNQSTHKNSMSSSQAESKISLKFTLPIALVVHAGLILGLSFGIDLPAKTNNATLLDITLVNMHSENAPDKAEIIAQTNLEASGDTQHKNRARSTMIADNLNPSDDISPIEATESAPEKPPVIQPMILTTKGETFKRVPKKPEQPEQEEPKPDTDNSDETTSEAQLAAELAEDEANYAEIPKVRYLNSSNAKSAVEAEYIDAWAKKIERIGTTNFPEEAIQLNRSGQLIITAIIDKQGNIKSSGIKQSSGTRILDKAALRIIRLAAPYPALPSKVTKKYDQLSITRTFLFDTGSRGTLRTQ